MIGDDLTIAGFSIGASMAKAQTGSSCEGAKYRPVASQGL
jgi:hypothetical protein